MFPIMNSCLKLACMLAISGLTYKVGTLNSYTLQNDNFLCSFCVSENHSSLNMSTKSHFQHHYENPQGFNVNIELLQNGEATVQYIDHENKLYTANLRYIIECANEFEKKKAQ